MQIEILIKSVIFLLWITCSAAMALGTYPYLFSAIGTPTYQAAEGYRKIVNLEHFSRSKEAMEQFIVQSERLKERGFNLEKENTKEERKAYIEALRKLEKQRNTIDRFVAESIQTLKLQSRRAELSTLATNPYLPIREMAKVVPSKTAVQGSVIPMAMEKDTETLRRSLIALREELQEARVKNSKNSACLNDLTAINYWMLKINRLKPEREWCKMREVSEQITAFEHAARKNCGKESAGYLEWSGASLSYRTTLKQMYEEACQR